MHPPPVLPSPLIVTALPIPPTHTQSNHNKQTNKQTNQSVELAGYDKELRRTVDEMAASDVGYGCFRLLNRVTQVRCCVSVVSSTASPRFLLFFCFGYYRVVVVLFRNPRVRNRILQVLSFVYRWVGV